MSQSLKIDDEFLSLQGAADEFGIEWAGFPDVVRREVTTPDGAVSSVRWGAEPVEAVLLHGRAPGQSARSWDVVALDWGAPVLAVDTPGHGYSVQRPDRRYTPRLIAPAVATAVEALAPDPSIVVGVSFGGLTTIALAAVRPELVKAIALVDILPRFKAPPADSPAPEAKADPGPPAAPERFGSQEEIVDSLSNGATLSRETIARSVAANTVQLEDGSWIWRFDAGVSVAPGELDFPGLWDDLLAVRVPILVVRGGKSPVVSDEVVAELQERRPDVTVVSVADSGHEIHDERPRELAEILADFSSSLAS
jgi:pimeloyl-ACP methyl ester carboxylesterase